jgi:hypothetical protein
MKKEKNEDRKTGEKDKERETVNERKIREIDIKDKENEERRNIKRDSM